MKKFGLIGAAGYIAPRHMKAIKDTGNDLIAALDISDSVGIIDSYFPNASFFTAFERFDRYIEKLKYEESTFLDYISICSPNYFHDAHIRFALRSGAHAICEKPLVINIENLDKLSLVEQKTNKKIYNVLQLRLHPSIVKLKNKIINSPEKIFDVELTYITSRGNWYDYSWKGDKSKSGGIATNIGVHFFDMLCWIFGEQLNINVFKNDSKVSSGFLELKKANVKWFLSTDKNYLPEQTRQKNMTTYRSISIDGEEIEFSDGFTDLHTRVYEDILEGNGFSLKDAYSSIAIVDKIRNMNTSTLKEDYHPFLKSI
jgi:UDP-N-acetyl-2-amino-2-deoxyglucuronate dehydrogenase